MLRASLLISVCATYKGIIAALCKTISPVSASIDAEEIKSASDSVESGTISRLSTETVYGLGCDAGNAERRLLVFTGLRDRPGEHPVIVHLSSVDQLKDWA